MKKKWCGNDEGEEDKWAQDKHVGVTFPIARWHYTYQILEVTKASGFLIFRSHFPAYDWQFYR